jgi:hypothetical protein
MQAITTTPGWIISAARDRPAAAMRKLEIVAGALLAALFLIGWVGGVCAWFYTVYHSILGRFKPSHQSKALAGVRAFRAFWLFGVLIWLTGVVLFVLVAGTISR